MSQLNLHNHFMVGIERNSYVEDLAGRIAISIYKDSSCNDLDIQQLDKQPLKYLMSLVNMSLMTDDERNTEHERLIQVQLSLAEACTLAMRRILDTECDQPYDSLVFLHAVCTYYRTLSDRVE